MSYTLEDLFKYSESDLDTFISQNIPNNVSTTLLEKRFDIIKLLSENFLIKDLEPFNFLNKYDDFKKANTYDEYLEILIDNDYKHIFIPKIIQRYGFLYFCNLIRKNKYKYLFISMNFSIDEFKMLCSTIKYDELILLSLKKCRIDDDKLKILVDNIKYLNIKKLQLQNNMIGNTGIEYLIYNFNNNINELFLDNNPYDSTILKNLSNFIQKNNNLSTLELNEMNINNFQPDYKIYYDFVKIKIKYNQIYKSYIKLEMENIKLLPMYLKGNVVPGALQDYNEFLKKIKL